MKRLNNIPNFKLIKNIFITLLEEDVPASNAESIANKLNDQILRASLSVLLANASDSDLTSFKSKNKRRKKEALERIVKKGIVNPTVKKELQELLNKILTDINVEISSIK